MTQASRPSNRLIHEKSPYLLQHAHNPVDWYPWGEEAFNKARSEDKPILLSIGYSTCHWCHVMERESYEDPVTAELMNQYLVNIKVDREERPDVDKIYMTAISLMTGQGGWPLNAFLTPDLQPLYGGTYFPPEARWGHPAWKDVVQHLGRAWRNPEERQKMVDSAAHLTESLRKYSAAVSQPLDGHAEWLASAYGALRNVYDAELGGFGSAPKFPMPVYHNFLLRYYSRTKDQTALDMSMHTLHEMAKGGIYDHLGGGFARYSTDARWHIPHFEKMLYDNAQLAVNYLEAYQIRNDPAFKKTAEETLRYVQREMTHPRGGFYSAEDADSLPAEDAPHKVEGAFYVWEQPEITTILGERAASLFNYRYGVREGGNAAQDPHGEFKNKNILYAAHTLEETALKFRLKESETEAQLKDAQTTLFQSRGMRPRPSLDDKIISGWNGLMMTAFAKGFQVLGEKTYLASAQAAALFVKEHLYDAAAKTLYRSWRDGGRQACGIADDYAFVVQGLLDLYESDFDSTWLVWAVGLTESMVTRFYDAATGGFFMTAQDQDKHLLLRVKEDSDNVEPAASSVAVLNLLRLSQLLDRDDFETLARKTLQFYGETMKESPRALPQMLVALDFALAEPFQVVVAGKRGAQDTEGLLDVVRERFLPVKTLVLADEKHAMKPINGKAAAYVCLRHSCKEPTTDVQKLRELLN